MDNLRLILIVLGLIILAAIVLLHRPPGQSQPNHARWRQSRREPNLGEAETDGSTGESADEAGEEDDSAVNTQDSFPAVERRRAAAEKSMSSSDHLSSAEGIAEDASAKIVTLYVRRRHERPIVGSDLLDAAVKAGLSFGEMNIFHRRQEGADKPVFSMANLTPPGHFDASSWNIFDTPGVTLFAALPGPISALDTWDAMLATGSRIAELLEAELLDDTKCRLTRQRIAQIREEMREFDRLNGLGAY